MKRAKAHNWQERVLQRDIDLGKKLEEKTNSAVLDMKANYRKVIALAMRSAITNIKDGKLACDSVADMERLIKLDLLLMGEFEQEKQGDANVHVNIDVEEGLCYNAGRDDKIEHRESEGSSCPKNRRHYNEDFKKNAVKLSYATSKDSSRSLRGFGDQSDDAVSLAQEVHQ